MSALDDRDRSELRGLLTGALGLSQPAAMAIFCGKYVEADRLLRDFEA